MRRLFARARAHPWVTSVVLGLVATGIAALVTTWLRAGLIGIVIFVWCRLVLGRPGRRTSRTRRRRPSQTAD